MIEGRLIGVSIVATQHAGGQAERDRHADVAERQEQGAHQHEYPAVAHVGRRVYSKFMS